MLVSLATILLVLLALKLGVLLLEPRLAFYPLRGGGPTPRDLGIAFYEVRVETSDGETLTVWHLPHPRARAQVVFWHGNGGNLSIWLDVIAGIHGRGFDVVAPDYRGYGTSTGRPTERGLYRDADAVLAHFGEQLHRGRPVVYWGRSLGATVAAYTTSLAEPDAVILEAPFHDAMSLLRSDPLLALLSLFASYRFPTAEFLAGYDRPTLVLHGELDSVVPLEQGSRLHERLRGPKRFVTIRGAGHDDLHLADPEAYWGAVDRFVEQIGR